VAINAHLRTPSTVLLSLRLLFVAGGLYLGFDFVLAFYYIGIGLISCSYGVAIFLMRLRYRRAQPAVEAAAPVEDTPAAGDDSATD